MREANAESLGDVYIYTHTLYLQNIRIGGQSGESRNLENEGFISSVRKLYIKYRELKIKLTNGIRISDVRNKTSDISVSYLIFLLYTKNNKEKRQEKNKKRRRR